MESTKLGLWFGIDFWVGRLEKWGERRRGQIANKLFTVINKQTNYTRSQKIRYSSSLVNWKLNSHDCTHLFIFYCLPQFTSFLGNVQKSYSRIVILDFFPVFIEPHHITGGRSLGSIRIFYFLCLLFSWFIWLQNQILYSATQTSNIFL